MPLFMDFHKFPGITIQGAKTAHVADVNIQAKFGVCYHRFWVNEREGTIFCLVEGPDKETCEVVHQTAHGHVACAMVELDRDLYELMMGGNNPVDQWGLVHHENGSVDLGYRNVISIVLRISPTSGITSGEYLKSSKVITDLILAKLSKFNGRIVKPRGSDCIVSVLTDTAQAIQCAKEIQRELTLLKGDLGKRKLKLSFGIGLSAGQPVTENDGFFEEAMKLSRRLSQTAAEDAIQISSLIRELCVTEKLDDQNASIRSLRVAEETYLTKFLDSVELKLSDEKFNIDTLCQDIGTSRSQLHRKISTYTGKSPSDLIRDLRLDSAFYLLKHKLGNISEISMSAGFSSPSYFSKCFTRKFGCSPSKFVEIVNTP